MNIGIIRYRMAISYVTSVLYDLVRLSRLKRTTIPYDLACDIHTYDMTYDIAYLGLRSRQVALAMPLGRPQVLPHDLRPCRKVCTAS